jgi:hypothetical protein
MVYVGLGGEFFNAIDPFGRYPGKYLQTVPTSGPTNIFLEW